MQAHPLAGHGPDAGQQLLKVKGLDQIVIPPQVQALHPVGHTVAGGEEEDGGVVPLVPQLLDQGVAVLFGQHHIQQDAVILRPQQMGLGVLAVKAAVHGVARLGQNFSQQQVQVALIFHH